VGAVGALENEGELRRSCGLRAGIAGWRLGVDPTGGPTCQEK
jgi:hypothetical protein